MCKRSRQPDFGFISLEAARRLLDGPLPEDRTPAGYYEEVLDLYAPYVYEECECDE